MVRPLGNHIVVRRWPEEEQTESGLWLPSDAREKPQLGDVLAVGPGARYTHRDRLGKFWTGSSKPARLNAKGVQNALINYANYCGRQPIDIEPGEVVIFAKMVSRDHEYWVDGEKLLILPYDTIYCAVTGL